MGATRRQLTALVVALAVNAGMVVALMLMKVSVRETASSAPFLRVVPLSPAPHQPPDASRAAVEVPRDAAPVIPLPAPILDVPSDLSPTPRIDWNEAASAVAREQSELLPGGHSAGSQLHPASPTHREIWDESIINRVTQTPAGISIMLNERCSLLVGTVYGPSGPGTGVQSGCGVGKKEARDDLFEDFMNSRAGKGR